MRKLSVWAKHHAAAARVIIIISHVFLILIASFLAKQVTAYGFEVSPLWLYFLVAVFFVAGQPTRPGDQREII